MYSTVAIAVIPENTYWIVLNSRWNIFVFENFGCLSSRLQNCYYKHPSAVDVIKKMWLERLISGHRYRNLTVIRFMTEWSISKLLLNNSLVAIEKCRIWSNDRCYYYFDEKHSWWYNLARKLSCWTDKIVYLVQCIVELQMTTTENSKLYTERTNIQMPSFPYCLGWDIMSGNLSTFKSNVIWKRKNIFFNAMLNVAPSDINSNSTWKPSVQIQEVAQGHQNRLLVLTINVNDVL